MKKQYRIIVEAANKNLSEFIVKTIFATPSCKQLCVVESEPGKTNTGIGANLIIVDGNRDIQSLTALADAASAANPRVIVLNFRKDPITDESKRLLGIPEDVFCRSFAEVMEFCYLNAVSRDSLVDSAYQEVEWKG